MRCWYPSCFDIDLKGNRSKHELSRYNKQFFFNSTPKPHGLVTCLGYWRSAGSTNPNVLGRYILMEVIHSSGIAFGWKRKSGYN